MGRRRNPVLSEYFHRHDKLQDSSNRYEQSCKACGERFPKGRSETLIAHLTKHCRILSESDRLRAMQQLNSSSDEGASPQETPSQQHPSQAQTAMTALDALAEISSQHLSTRDSGANASTLGVHDRTSRPLSAEDLLVDDKMDPGLENPQGSPGTEASFMAYNKTPDPSLMMYRPNTFLNVPNTAGTSLSMASSTGAMSSPILTSAEVQSTFGNPGFPVEPDIGIQNPANASLSDQYFNRQRTGWPVQNQGPNLAMSPPMGQNNIDPSLQESTTTSQTSQLYPLRPASHPRPIAAHPSSNQNVGTEAKAKQRIRQRFTDDRRKQVQQVRQMGSCLRCRMLKKTCDSDNPCSTCRGIENPRLWTVVCSRTRMKQDFRLFGDNTHQKAALEATNQIKQSMALHNMTGRIEMTNFPDDLKFATFTVLRGSHGDASAIDPALLGGDKHQSVDDIYIIDGTSDDVVDKLKVYFENNKKLFFNAEQSTFMKPTVLIANDLANAATDNAREEAAKKLLKSAVSLWNLVGISTSTGPPCHIYINRSQAASANPASMTREEIDAMSSHRKELLPNTDGVSYDTILKQILHAIEKRITIDASHIMDELERQLLRVPHHGKFELFLVGVILLGCAERICAHVRGTMSETTTSTTQQDLAQQSRQAAQALGILGENVDDSWQNQSSVSNIDQALVDALGAGSSTEGPMDMDMAPSDQQAGQTHEHSNPSHDENGVDKSTEHDQSSNDEAINAASQGEKLTEKVKFYFTMRSMIPKLEVKPENGFYTNVSGNGYEADDVTLEKWFTDIKLSPEDIANDKRLVNGGFGNYVASIFQA